MKILYSSILNKNYNNRSELLNDIDTLEKTFPSGSSIGELKTYRQVFNDIYSKTENLTLTKAGIIHY